MLRAPEVVLVNIRRDFAAQIGAGILIEAKMDASNVPHNLARAVARRQSLMSKPGEISGRRDAKETRVLVNCDALR
jgi:hypothetical protein